MLVRVSHTFNDQPIDFIICRSLVARKKDQAKIDGWLPFGILQGNMGVFSGCFISPSHSISTCISPIALFALEPAVFSLKRIGRQGDFARHRTPIKVGPVQIAPLTVETGNTLQQGVPVIVILT